RPGDDPGLFAEQRDGQFTLGAERLSAAGFPGLGRQLRAAEVEPPGTGQEPGGLLGLVEQGAEDHPVVGPDGRGPVGAASRVLMEGAGPPDVGTGAMDFGVVGGPDVVSVP